MESENLFETEHKIHFEQGIQLYKNDQYAEALKEFEECIKLCPNDDISCHYIGLIYTAKHDIILAEQFFKRCIGINSYCFDYHYSYGKLLSDNNKFIEATTEFKICVALDSTNYILFVDLGNCYLKLKNYNDAIINYNRSVELNNISVELNLTNYDSYFYLGCCYSHLDKYVDAITNYKKCIELKQDDYMAFLKIGVCYQNLNENIDAISNYKKCIELRDFGEAYFGLGSCYLDLGKYAESIINYKKCVELNHGTAYCSYSNIGLCYKTMKEYDNAITTYKKCIELKPDDLDSYLSLGYCYYQLNDDINSIENYKKCIELKQDCCSAYFGLGNCYCDLQNDFYMAFVEYKKMDNIISKVKPNTHCVRNILITLTNYEKNIYLSEKMMANFFDSDPYATIHILLLIQHDFNKHNFVNSNLSSLLDDYLNEQESCVICFEKILSEDKSRKCNVCEHYLHRKCLARWKKIRRTCPYCNSPQ